MVHIFGEERVKQHRWIRKCTDPKSKTNLAYLTATKSNVWMGESVVKEVAVYRDKSGRKQTS